MAVLRATAALRLGFLANPQKRSRSPGISGLAVNSGHLEGMCCRRFKIDPVVSYPVNHPDTLEAPCPMPAGEPPWRVNQKSAPGSKTCRHQQSLTFAYERGVSNDSDVIISAFSYPAKATRQSTQQDPQ